MSTKTTLTPESMEAARLLCRRLVEMKPQDQIEAVASALEESVARGALDMLTSTMVQSGELRLKGAPRPTVEQMVERGKRALRPIVAGASAAELMEVAQQLGLVLTEPA